MRKPETTWDRARFPLVMLGAGLLEAPLAGSLFADAPLLPVSGMAACHIGAAVLVFFAPPKDWGWLRRTRHWCEPMVVLTFCLPGIGWLGAWLLWFWHDPRSSKPGLFKLEEMEAKEVCYPAQRGFQGRSSLERRVMDKADVMPAADILLGQDVELKQSAIETLAKIRTPEAVRWLLRVRRDPMPEVRFHATSTLTSLKREFETRLRTLQREVYDNPADLGRELARSQVAYEYALSGLVDAERRGELLINALQRLRKLSESDNSALVLLYRIEKEIDPAVAVQTLERLRARVVEKEEGDWLKEQAQLSFRLGRIGDVRAIFARLRAEGRPAGLRSDSLTDSLTEADWQSAAIWWLDA